MSEITNPLLPPSGGSEMKELRDLYTKRFLEREEDGLLHCSQRSFGLPVHYDNKLGVGDGVRGFRTMDFTLSEKEDGGWTFLFNNFIPDLPLYADDWQEFRDLFGAKDQLLNFKAVASHVEGRLVAADALASDGLQNLTTVNAVIHDDAFGVGSDHVVYFQRSGMRKCARIRSAYKESKEYTFDWEFDPPEGCEIWRVGDDGEYQLDTTRPKDFDTEKCTELRTADGTTFLAPFRVWDSGEGSNYHEAVCTVSYFKDEQGRMFLRKHIPASFIDASVGDVFCDTTQNYTSGSGDGASYNSQTNATWATMLGAGTGQNTATNPYMFNIVESSSTTNQWRTLNVSGWYFAYTGIPAGGTMTGASLNVRGSTVSNASTFSQNIVVTKFTTTDTAMLAAHYTNRATLCNVEIASRLAFTSFSTTAYNVFALTDLSYVAVGTVKLATMPSCLFDSSMPTWSSNVESRLNCYFSEDATYPPFLQVEYTAPSTRKPELSRGGGVIGGIGY